LTIHRKHRKLLNSLEFLYSSLMFIHACYISYFDDCVSSGNGPDVTMTMTLCSVVDKYQLPGCTVSYLKRL